MDYLADASLHRLGDLPGISGDDDASRAAHVEVVDRSVNLPSPRAVFFKRHFAARPPLRSCF
jgi:hypothetical protein